MKNLITLILASLLGFAALSTLAPAQAHADPYWNNYWSWYDGNSRRGDRDRDWRDDRNRRDDRDWRDDDRRWRDNDDRWRRDRRDRDWYDDRYRYGRRGYYRPNYYGYGPYYREYYGTPQYGYGENRWGGEEVRVGPLRSRWR